MHKISALIAIIAVGLAALHATGESLEAFRGEVADSQCAMNVHSMTRSHREMLKGKSMGNTPADCSRYCIEHLGGKVVLVSGKDVRYMDGPETLMQYLGKKVRVRGALEKATNTIHISKIELAE